MDSSPFKFHRNFMIGEADVGTSFEAGSFKGWRTRTLKDAIPELGHSLGSHLGPTNLRVHVVASTL